MDPFIEKIFNDNVMNFEIINELVDYLRLKYDEEPSFTLACFKNGLQADEKNELFMLYSDLTYDLSPKDSDLIDRKLLIQKTREKFPKLSYANIPAIIESYINCYFLTKD